MRTEIRDFLGRTPRVGSLKVDVLKVNTVAIAVFSLFRGIGAGTFMTLFPLYMVELGYGMGAIGAVASLSTIPVIALLPFIGILIDWIGRKPIVTLTGITTFFALFIPAFTDSYYALLLSYMLNFFSFLAGQSSRSALLADSIEDEAGIAFAKIFMPFNAARTVAPFAAGLLAEILGFRTVFLFFGIITLLGTSFFMFYSVEPTEKKEKAALKKELKNAFTLEGGILRVYLFAIIDGFAWQLWYQLLNAHLKELSMSPSEIGILGSVNYGMMFLAAYFSGRIIDRIGPLKSLALSETSGISAALMLGFGPGGLLVGASMILIGFSFSLRIIGYNVAVANGSDQRQRGKAYSKMNTFRALFSVPAPYLGGFLYETIASSTPFIVSALLMTANILSLKRRQLAG